MDAYSTGLEALDRTLQTVFPGDNLVWDIEEIEDYLPFADAYATAASERGHELVYFRFADHREVFAKDDPRITRVELDPALGFEHFVSAVIDVIETKGKAAWYLLDCLSPLAQLWYADRMMANFYLIVCPYVLKIKALAFFAVYKHNHSNHATDTIYNTAQVITEVWRHQGALYIQMQKVEGRSSRTMYMLHRMEGGDFVPVRNSAHTAEVVARVKNPLLNFTIQRTGPWTASYQESREITAAIERGEDRQEEARRLFERLIHMTITRQTSFLPLAHRYFTLPFINDILKRLIGSGLIGGKARGILIAQEILRAADPAWDDILEVHDSFFIGSDVFYTYLIINDVWWLRRKKGPIADILERARRAREKILAGTFLDYIQVQFAEMLEYFGQSPIIVRSSSIQEDSYGNAFSGKYESVFCANQGTPEERLAAFLDAVRTVYASSLSEEALLYRLHHGLLYEDEQMALVVQRVSGDEWGDWFFPCAGGVGFSYNPFAWNPSIDPHAGMLRLAFGLGTRAVDRIDDDYTRIVALNQPLLRPDKRADDSVKYVQRKIDLIDIGGNCFTTKPLKEALARLPPTVLAQFATRDEEAAARARELGIDEAGALRLDFKGLLERSDFCSRMQSLLVTLEKAYAHPVDIEFTVNMDREGAYRINLVQCRPFKVKIVGAGDIGLVPSNLPQGAVFMKSDGPVVGRSLAAPVDRLVYVRPEVYTKLGEQDRYAVARLVGKLVHLPHDKKEPVVMLVGPGRWGTSTASLGVPVQFNDIKGVSIMVELALMHQGLVPDVSLGTHFFNDLVEMDMLYFALFPDRPDCLLDEAFLERARAHMIEVPPTEELHRGAVVVLDAKSDNDLRIHADATAQRVLCYRG